MTASNHFVTSAVLGTVIANPWIGIPVAVASHFVLDALPHYGCPVFHKDKPGEIRLYFAVLAVDAIIFLALMVWAIVAIDNALLAAYGFAGFSPDIVWLYRYGVLARIGKVDKPPGKIEAFHHRIQKFESMGGLLVEIPYFIAIGALLLWILQ